MLVRSAALALLTALSGFLNAASAQDPFVAELRSVVPDSSRTRVLVLATPHLARIGVEVTPEALEPVLDVLAEFAPDIVLVEAYGPDDVERLALAAEREPGGVADRIAQARASLGVTFGRVAQDELDLTRTEADAEADSLLAAGLLSPADRQRAALLLLAAHDVWSAVLHWTQVPDSLRGETSPDRLGPRYPDWTAAEALSFVAATDRTELLRVGVETARRAGLDRVYGFDGLAEVEAEARSPYAARLAAEVAGDPVYVAAQGAGQAFVEGLRARQVAAAEHGDLLGLYRYFNSDEYAQEAAEAEQIWLRTAAPSGLDRARWALWETRNLQMAARLRAATAFRPGARVVAIVGASHKPYLEAVLRTLADTEVLDFSDVASQVGR